jgi:hypothetical protein
MVPSWARPSADSTSGAALPTSAKPLPTLKEYLYAERTFKISLPEEWGTRSDKFVPLIAAPKEVFNTGDEFPSVKVAVLPMREGLTLDTLATEAKKQYGDFWKVRTDEYKKLGSLDVRMMTIDQTLQTTDKRKVKSCLLKMFVLGKNNYYVITGTSKATFYNDYAPLFQKIMESFQPI